MRRARDNRPTGNHDLYYHKSFHHFYMQPASSRCERPQPTVKSRETSLAEISLLCGSLGTAGPGGLRGRSGDARGDQLLEAIDVGPHDGEAGAPEVGRADVDA